MAEDRVQVPSLRKDGTPDQTDNFEIIGDKDAAVAAIAEQLAQQKISEVDQQRAAEQAAVEGPTLSPEEQARKDQHDALADEAQSEAEALVEARWVDPASRQSEPEETTTRSSRRRSQAAEAAE